jgi:hypothetical protein
MAYLVDEFGFIFFSAPATGSTAFIRAFQERSLGRFYPENDLVEGDRRLVPRKHSTVVQMLDNGLLCDASNLKRVVGVRNPFSFHVAKYLRNRTRRLKQVENPNSWINKLPEADRKRYVYRIRKNAGQSFKEYLLQELGDEPYEVQADFHVGIDFYLHQEAVDADFERLKGELGIPACITIPLVNVTGALERGSSYKDFYDKDDIDLVYEMNAPFFEKFPEYGFDGLRRQD